MRKVAQFSRLEASVSRRFFVEVAQKYEQKFIPNFSTNIVKALAKKEKVVYN